MIIIDLPTDFLFNAILWLLFDPYSIIYGSSSSATSIIENTDLLVPGALQYPLRIFLF
jgi:hypothetical protein